MSRNFLTFGLLLAPIAFQFITYKSEIATGPVASFLDTGTDEVEEIDPLSVWPNKILVDAKANIILMVWFDDEGVRHTKIPFDDVNYLKNIPRHGKKRAELHIALKDGRIFLGAADSQSINQQAILLQGTLGKKIEKGSPLKKRRKQEKKAALLPLAASFGTPLFSYPVRWIVSEHQKCIDLSFPFSLRFFSAPVCAGFRCLLFGRAASVFS